MANNIVSKVVVTGAQKDLARFTEKVITKIPGDPDEDLIFNFHKLVPMPKTFEDSPNDSDSDHAWIVWYGSDFDLNEIFKYDWAKAAGFTTRQELQEYLDKKDPAYKAQADLMQSNFEQYGAKTAYDWHIQNWGTKWNSYNFQWVKKGGPKEWSPVASEISFRFTTAWSPPEPVFHTMSEQFPELEFLVATWGGDFGCVGRFYEGVGLFDCGDPTPDIYELVYDEPMPPEMQE